ncbi:MAG: HD domain-containing protein [Usitatibacteraceae bacterium]
MMDSDRLKSIVAFIQAAEQLKDTLRTGITAQGRPESTAEHSWRLCLLVMMFNKELEGADQLRLLKLCIVHDLGEAISGDVPATRQNPNDNKAERERCDLKTLCRDLPDDLQAEIMGLWDEYDAAATNEATLVKGFDKIETMLQHLIGKNAPDFDFEFNLTYGLETTNRVPLLRQIRTLVDDATKMQIAKT